MDISSADIVNQCNELTVAGGIFELEKFTLSGREYRGFKNAPKSAVDVIQAARGHGDNDFVVYEDQRLTYTQYFGMVDAFAAALSHSYGVKKGDRVAIAMRNNPHWVIAYAAATLLGATLVPINSWGKTEELQYAVNDCSAKLLVCDTARLELLDDDFGSLNIEVIVSSTDKDHVAGDRKRDFESVLLEGHGQSYTVSEISPEDYAVILYTSGSTGFPKGVAHRHIAIGQALMNMFFAGYLVMQLEGPQEPSGGAVLEAPMLTVPLFHATGLLSGFYLPLQMGQKTVMMYKWDADKALQLIQEEKVTALSSVPAIVQDLLNHEKFDQYDTSSLSRVTAAGAATPTGLPELIEEKIGKVNRGAGYGMTESLAVGSLMTGPIFDMKPASSGIISPIMDFRFIGDDGEPLIQGQTGEIELRGITCTSGYWEKPEANETIFDDDGWMKTGDVGLVDDDGFIHITGRIKEIVIRGGENIYPGEIENVAYGMDGVHEVVVFGEPDDKLGEELVIVAYCQDDQSVTPFTLREYLTSRLATYKVPKTIVLWDAPLPRNASEKLHKLKVKELYLERTHQ